MYSAKTIQKKLEKAIPSRAAKDKVPGKRKRKNGRTALDSVTTKKQRRDSLKADPAAATAPTTAAAPHNPGKETDINKNKVPGPPSTHSNGTVDRKKQNKLKKKKKLKNNKKDKAAKATEQKGVREAFNTSPQEPASLPVLYADSGESGRQLWHDSESVGICTPPQQYPDSTPKNFMEQSSDSEHSMTGRKQKHKNSRLKKKGSQHREDREKTEPINKSLVGECLAVTATNRGSVVAALTPSTTLYLQGCVVVCPLLGSAEVLGYVLQEGQSQPMYSLPSASLLGVTALEGREVESTHASLQCLPSPWLESLAEKNTQVMLLEVHPHTSPRVNFLVSAGWGFLGKCWDWQKPWHTVNASIVTRGNCHKNRVTHILPEWREAAQTVVMNWKCGAVPRVVVGGGKGVGKSTFFKYLVNTLVSAQSDAGVLCLDFDPGQPELSLPTSLSLTHLTKPLLGPAYTHDLRNMSVHHRHILVGAVSPQFVLEEYVAAVQDLCREAGAVEGELPLLVNTMGWTQGTGLGLMLDVVRLVQPTHLMQIQSHKDARNYPFPLDGEAVGRARGGIATRAGDHELHYSLTLLPSAGQGEAAPHMSQPRALRELRVLAEAGQAVEHGCRVTVPWAKVAMHVCEEQVPRDRILLVLNAQLVALCRVEPGSLHTLRQDLPQLLAHDTGFGHLLGWAVVMGIDPLTSDLHLATLLPAQEVTEQVNALIMPRIHLPASFYKLFCEGKGPYLKEGSREGASRLRVGRRIKPRGPKN